MINRKKVKEIQKVVWAHYEKNGRHTLPWRKTKDPYRILVSEVMLQQTQVARVIPKYQAFLKRFKTLSVLAEAPLREVLVMWQGLGYNRRAKALHELAKIVVSEHGRKLPKTYEELVRLPGIGPYTASAICAFAYGIARPMVETNIRTVLFYHFPFSKGAVSDAELLPIVEEMLDTVKPRDWYYALMDYGTFLKEQGVRSNAMSAHYTPQTKFKGSEREIRGAILRHLSKVAEEGEKNLVRALPFNVVKIRTQLKNLEKEGMVRKVENHWSL